MSLQEFDTSDEVPNFSRLKTYKPSPQVTQVLGPDRISLIFWPDLAKDDFSHANIVGKNPRFLGGPRIFLKGIGFVIPRFSSEQAKRIQEENELMSMYAVDAPDKDPSKAIQMKAITLIVVWPKPGTNKPPEVLPWILAASYFEEIKAKHARFPLSGYDLEVEAKAKGEYTELKFEIAQGNLLVELLKKREAGEPGPTATVNAILAKARELLPRLGPEMGKDLSIAEIKQRRGRGSSPNVPLPEAAAVSTDVASLVAGILAD